MSKTLTADPVPTILKQMSEIREVAEKTYLLEARLPRETGNFSAYAVYLINEGGGALVEPGPAALLPCIQEGMEKLSMGSLSYILPTHIHVDHGGGAGTLARLFPQARVLVHPSGARHMTDPARLVESTRRVLGADFEERFGPILPIPEARLRVPEDGETLALDGRKLQAIYSPGHAPHHLSFLDLKTGGLFCGEALGIPEYGTAFPPLPFVTPPGFDLEVYLETIEKLRALRPKLLFYSHHEVGLEPERLISVVEENTRAFGDITLQASKAGAPEQEIERKLLDYLHRRFGAKVGRSDLSLIISGYVFYFRKKGLLPPEA